MGLFFERQPKFGPANNASVHVDDAESVGLHLLCGGEAAAAAAAIYIICARAVETSFSFGKRCRVEPVDVSCSGEVAFGKFLSLSHVEHNAGGVGFGCFIELLRL